MAKNSQIVKNSKIRSVNQRIFGAAMIVAMGTILVKILAIVKELVVAYQFGTATELDAFLIAYTIPSFLINIIAGTFNSALMPTYIKVREQEGIDAAKKLFAGATVWSIGLLVATTLIMLVTMPLYLPALTQGFSPEKLALTNGLLLAVAPMLLLSGIGTIWGAVLNAGERFGLVALAPMLTPALTMILLFGFKSWGVFNLSIGMVLGQLAEMLIIGMVLTRQGFSLRPQWYGFDSHLQEVASQYGPAIVGSFLMCSTGLIDQSMAAMLPAGNVAALNYGSRIVTLPIIIASTALSTAVMPYFSRMVATEDWPNIRKSFKHYLGLIFLASAPLTGLIIFGSETIVRLLLQRGSFTPEDTLVVAQIQSCFAIQIPFYIGCMLIVRLVSAMRTNKIMMWGSAGNLAVNIGLNYLLMQWLGVAGIALSTSCVYIFSFFFLLFFVLRNLKEIDSIGLTVEQKSQIEHLQESKFEKINTVLTPEQYEAFQQMKLQRTSEPKGIEGVNLSADQKNQLRTIRQENIARLKLILTPDQVFKLEQATGLDKGIAILFLRGFRHGQMEKMNFSSEQKAKIKQLLIEDRQQIESVMTQEQQQRTIALQTRNRAVKEGWKSLNLTPDQKAAMKAIRDAKKQELNTILTPEQQEKIKTGKGKYRME
jgi:putative peptidoglycan lipid II flippase